MQILRDMEKFSSRTARAHRADLFWVGMSLYHPEKLGGFEPNFVDDHRWASFMFREEP